MSLARINQYEGKRANIRTFSLKHLGTKAPHINEEPTILHDSYRISLFLIRRQQESNISGNNKILKFNRRSPVKANIDLPIKIILTIINISKL